jgi:hypothetical protein
VQKPISRKYSFPAAGRLCRLFSVASAGRSVVEAPFASDCPLPEIFATAAVVFKLKKRRCATVTGYADILAFLTQLAGMSENVRS